MGLHSCLESNNDGGYNGTVNNTSKGYTCTIRVVERLKVLLVFATIRYAYDICGAMHVHVMLLVMCTCIAYRECW